MTHIWQYRALRPCPTFAFQKFALCHPAPHIFTHKSVSPAQLQRVPPAFVQQYRVLVVHINFLFTYFSLEPILDNKCCFTFFIVPPSLSVEPHYLTLQSRVTYLLFKSPSPSSSLPQYSLMVQLQSPALFCIKYS